MAAEPRNAKHIFLREFVPAQGVCETSSSEREFTNAINPDISSTSGKVYLTLPTVEEVIELEGAPEPLPGGVYWQARRTDGGATSLSLNDVNGHIKGFVVHNSRRFRFEQVNETTRVLLSSATPATAPCDSCADAAFSQAVDCASPAPAMTNPEVTVLLVYPSSQKREDFECVARKTACEYLRVGVKLSFYVLASDHKYTMTTDVALEHMVDNSVPAMGAAAPMDLVCARACAHADVVGLVSLGGSSGRACVRLLASRAFFVAGLIGTSDNWLLMHELGHVFGAGHRNAMCRPFTFGQAWTETDRTVMYEGSEMRQPYFSDPTVVPAGVQGKDFNNKCAVRMWAPEVAKYGDGLDSSGCDCDAVEALEPKPCGEPSC